MKRLLWLTLFSMATIAAAGQDQSPQARQHATIDGAVAGLDSFAARFGPNFEFRLTARGGYWDAGIFLVGPKKQGNDISEMTVPWSGPNARYIIGWNFLPYQNAPSTERTIVFSPEVGDTITWDMLQSNDTPVIKRLVDRIYGFGRADIVLSDVRLANVPADTRSDAIYDTTIISFKFRVEVSWPSTYKGVKR
ncbi:MAG: hypothetical protein ACXW34_09020 [Nitrospira sp.]